MQRWSPWNLPGPTLYGYETTDNVATVSATNYFDLNDDSGSIFQFSVDDQINASCSDGIVYLQVVNINPVETQVDFVEIGPNSVYTAAIQDHAVTPIKTTGLAFESLNNLSGVSINTTLVSDADNTDDLGTFATRWANVYATNYSTDHTAGHTFTLSGWDVDGAVSVPFLTITANNTPTAVLSGSVTGITQPLATNTTQLATTAFVIANAGTSGANTALSNLAAVAINTTLVSDADVTDDLGTFTFRWNNIFAANIGTDHTAGHTTTLSAWDVDGGSFTSFITLTANNTPTCALSGAVTGVTQALATNTTQLATTAFVIANAGTSGANTALSNLAATAVNTDIVPGLASDNAFDLGTPLTRFRNVYASGLNAGDGNSDTLTLRAWDVDGAVYVDFFTLSNGNTPTGVLTGVSATTFTFTTGSIGTAVTAVTQSASDNSTKVSTTAYADTAASAAAAASVPTSRTITVAGTANEITSSAGAQDLSANRTWTLSLPTALTFTGKTVTGGTFSGATITGSTATTFTFTTGSIGTAVTAVTQSPLTNNTTLATTAYTDAAVTAGSGISGVIGKVYPITFGGFSN